MRQSPTPYYLCRSGVLLPILTVSWSSPNRMARCRPRISDGIASFLLLTCVISLSAFTAHQRKRIDGEGLPLEMVIPDSFPTAVSLTIRKHLLIEEPNLFAEL